VVKLVVDLYVRKRIKNTIENSIRLLLICGTTHMLDTAGQLWSSVLQSVRRKKED